uniref:protein DDI1 homolog 2 isoform X2 n=1 Tax=Myxine glutinosa TaxID=7769 RepID=UPI00358F99DD
MQLTVYVERTGRPELAFSLDVGSDLDLENLKALCEAESGIPSQEMQLFHGERVIQGGNSTLLQFGLRDGDMVVLKQSRTPAGLGTRHALTQSTAELPNIDFGSINVPSTSRGSRLAQRNQSASRSHAPAEPISNQTQSPTIASRRSSAHSPSRELVEDPVALRETLLASPHDLALLRERNPPLADALLSGDLERFSTVLREQGAERAKRQAERIRLFNADPFDIDAQARIAEDIRQQNVEENMTMAMEEAPESFGQVVMLYINCTVNGHPVQAFVDSGAQMTIMSQAAAERCNIMRLVDRRWAGIAKGVGTQRIIGRVHLGQIQIERDFLPSSFSILEEQPMDMLLGLDMLKRHQCVIDLRRNLLVIGTTGTETRFLTESELPECARLALVGGSDPRSLSGGYSPSPGPTQAPPVTDVEDRELAEALQQSAYESELKIAIPPISNLPQGQISPSAAHHHISPPQPHAHDVRTPGNAAGEQASVLETLTTMSPSEVELVRTVRSDEVDFGVQASNQPAGVSAEKPRCQLLSSHRGDQNIVRFWTNWRQQPNWIQRSLVETEKNKLRVLVETEKNKLRVLVETEKNKLRVPALIAPAIPPFPALQHALVIRILVLGETLVLLQSYGELRFRLLRRRTEVRLM